LGVGAYPAILETTRNNVPTLIGVVPLLVDEVVCGTGGADYLADLSMFIKHTEVLAKWKPEVFGAFQLLVKNSFKYISG